MSLTDRRQPGDGENHIEAERFAEFADGLLSRRDREDIERHLARCRDCRTVFVDARALTGSGARVLPFQPRWAISAAVTLAAAAVLVVAIGVLPERQPYSERPEWEQLVAAASEQSTRPVVGRLSGGFRYAPPPAALRGAPRREVSADLRLASAQLEASLSDDRSPAALAEVGVARLVVGDYDGAIASLEQAIARDASDAARHSDLAAAYLARGQSSSRNEDFQRALAAADAALAINPALPEARFNRALILGALRRADAQDAWDAVAQLEPGSPWAREASTAAAP